MEEEFSRRQLQRPKAKKVPYVSIILFLLINFIALGWLLFFNIQAGTKFEQKLSAIENKMSELDRQVPVTTSSESTAASSNQTTESSIPSEGIQTTTQSSSPSGQDTSTTQEQTGSSSTTYSTPSSYTVKAGDTLSVIAEQNNLSLQRLMTLNGLTDATVYIGQVLTLQ